MTVLGSSCGPPPTGANMPAAADHALDALIEGSVVEASQPAEVDFDLVADHRGIGQNALEGIEKNEGR